MKKDEYEKMYELESSHFWFVAKRYYLQTYLKKIKSDISSVLDVGSGTGGTTKFLARCGNVVGVEPNEFALILAKKRGINIVQGSIDKLPFRKIKFDLITILDVLYHKNVKNVESSIKKVAKIVKPGGYLLITDSAFDFLRGRHSSELQESRRFTLTDIEKILTVNSFKTVSKSYIYSSIFPIIYLKRVVFEKFFHSKSSDVFKVPSIINDLLLNLLRLEAKLLEYFSFPVGSSLIILAKKNEQK